MIGINILSYPSQFLVAFDADNDIAVHTWSHPAIAKEVFGLTTVIWNQDTTDWNAPDAAHIHASMTRFLASPKSPGLMILEHESKDVTVAGFIQSYPLIASNGWNFASLARVIGDGLGHPGGQRLWVLGAY
ncbi:hypothetical protein NLJ89_g12288 [Agrocybe chaxingu]|uniref:Chitin deacetylase n=1 Tax=Agrocybe chaxingu TaxID=84603 RepID=A0A9W8JM53_9AGAR|nr:hypothetical protein NLJ89_g12288 [Agrocybe chaxingu]